MLVCDILRNQHAGELASSKPAQYKTKPVLTYLGDSAHNPSFDQNCEQEAIYSTNFRCTTLNSCNTYVLGALKGHAEKKAWFYSCLRTCETCGSSIILSSGVILG